MVAKISLVMHSNAANFVPTNEAGISLAVWRAWPNASLHSESKLATKSLAQFHQVHDALTHRSSWVAPDLSALGRRNSIAMTADLNH